MDLEKTIEFILEQHARTEALLAQTAARLDSTAAKLDSTAAKLEETAAMQKELAARQEAAEAQNAVHDLRLARLEHDLAKLARLGVKSRSRIHKRIEEERSRYDEIVADGQARHQAWAAKMEVTLAEITDKLNGLIGYVDRLPRNPQQT